MPSPVYENDREITFVEKVPLGLRIFLTIVGLVPMFLAPYELLVRPHWDGFSLYLIIPILVSIGMILLGGLFLVAGLLGLNQTIVFVKESRVIHYSYESTLMPLRRKTYRFNDIAKVLVTTHNWTDSPSTYGLQFMLRDGQKIEVGNFEKRIDAEEYMNKVENLIR
ncbi:MAG: hypothetical protein U0V02_02500 [Anaerolineales bacterium]